MRNFYCLLYFFEKLANCQRSQSNYISSLLTQKLTVIFLLSLIFFSYYYRINFIYFQIIHFFTILLHMYFNQYRNPMQIHIEECIWSLYAVIRMPIKQKYSNINLNKLMNQKYQSLPKLTVHNYKHVVDGLIKPHQELIAEAALHFKNKMIQYRSHQQPRRSNHMELPAQLERRSPSLLSDISAEYWPEEQTTNPFISEAKAKPYKLQEWQSSVKPCFKNYSNLTKHYEQLFYAKKYLRRNTKDFYDFKVDEKQMLTNIFNEIRTEQDSVEFQAIASFFDECKLFYLCYNIKPNNLIDILKDSAHLYSNKLTLIQFLNVFFIDRPNITSLFDNQSVKIAKHCILQEQSWKQLKLIFSTLDTFGNQTISMAPFLYKIKNNHSNRQLINQPTIQYPQIGRTLPLKKIIFNLENRYKFQDKISWPQIEQIIKNFKYLSEPTIDVIYRSMIERGKITRFSNYFMIGSEVIDEIKNIFNRCPKYCEYFIKTKFLCNQLLESPKIKANLKDAIVRVIQVGIKEKTTNLEQQIRLLAKQAEKYIDLDELLEYFTIKGPINTRPDAQIDVDQSDSQDVQEIQRLDKLKFIRNMEKAYYYKKTKNYPKPIRHLTVCEQFKLSARKRQATMQRKTREWAQSKEKQIQMQLNKKFKANPIPAQLNPQRYRQYQNKMNQIKQLKRQKFLKKRQEQNIIYQYLKTNTKLFASKQKIKTQPSEEKYKFMPKPIPWHIVQVNLLENINNQKNLRKKNLTNQKKLKIIRQWKKLPSVMQNYEDLTENDSLQNEANTSKHSSLDSNKKIKETTKIVPDFKKLHAQFEQQLNKKKQQFTPTVPISPKITEIHKKRVTFEANTQIQPVSLLRNKIPIQRNTSKPIPTTKKYQEMVEFTQNKLQERELERLRKEEQEIQRINKQYNFAKLMHKKLKKSLRKTVSLSNLTSEKVKKLKNEWGQLKKHNQQELYQMYSRVMARPFLFENKQQSQQKNHLQTKNKLKKIKASPNIWKDKNKQKHVHQSPLKQFDPQNESPENQQEPQQMYAQYIKEQSRNKAYLLNQSF